MKRTRILLGIFTMAALIGACTSEPTAPAATVQQVAAAHDETPLLPPGGTGGATTQSDSTCRGPGAIGSGGKDCEEQ